MNEDLIGKTYTSDAGVVFRVDGTWSINPSYVTVVVDDGKTVKNSLRSAGLVRRRLQLDGAL